MYPSIQSRSNVSDNKWWAYHVRVELGMHDTPPCAFPTRALAPLMGWDYGYRDVDHYLR